jgi:hypothetical protein
MVLFKRKRNPHLEGFVFVKLKKLSIMETTTVFKILGGGQRIRQLNWNNQPVEFVTDKNSDWVERAKCHGQCNFTGVMWSDDLETLQRWANEWAGTEVELVETLMYDKEPFEREGNETLT